MNQQELNNSLMSILFVSGDAVSIKDLSSSLEVSEEDISNAAEEMILKAEQENAGILIRRLPGKLQLCSNPKYTEKIDNALAPVRKSRLSQSLLETLAIIAYRQPITRIEIEQVRGVSCNYSLAMLIEHGLIVRSGKKKTLGNPMLYSTNDEFLRHFGIESLEDLPKLEMAE